MQTVKTNAVRTAAPSLCPAGAITRNIDIVVPNDPTAAHVARRRLCGEQTRQNTPAANAVHRQVWMNKILRYAME
jgi:hypothetical protein